MFYANDEGRKLCDEAHERMKQIDDSFVDHVNQSNSGDDNNSASAGAGVGVGVSNDDTHHEDNTSSSSATATATTTNNNTPTIKVNRPYNATSTDTPATEEEVKAANQHQYVHQHDHDHDYDKTRGSNSNKNPIEKESFLEYLKKSCVWCARSRGDEDRTVLEFLVRSQGIWLHALQYSLKGLDGEQVCYSTPLPSWSRF